MPVLLFFNIFFSKYKKLKALKTHLLGPAIKNIEMLFSARLFNVTGTPVLDTHWQASNIKGINAFKYFQ